MNKKVFIFFGPPGSGKGTQSDMLAAGLELPVISTGELLRHEQSMGSKLGKKVASLLKKGALVPDKLVEEMMNNRIAKKDAKNGFVLDGYPRDAEQLRNLAGVLQEKKIKKENVFIILVHVSDREVKKRLGGRRVCDCGAAYHLTYNPPKKKGICDLCGKKIYIRSDDRPATMSSRLKLYHKTTEPLLKLGQSMGKLIVINGDNGIKKIHQEIIKKIK